MQQARSPVREDRRDAVVVFLGDEIIVTRDPFEKQGVERCLFAIARMQMILDIGGGRDW